MRATVLLILAGMTALGCGSPALSQPAQGAPVETSEPTPLPSEKQKMILDQVRTSPDLPEAALKEPLRIGMVIPPEVELLELPQDAATTVPTVTTYDYVIAGDQIAIVEPESRKVIQFIRRQKNSLGALREPVSLEWKTLLVLRLSGPGERNDRALAWLGRIRRGACGSCGLRALGGRAHVRHQGLARAGLGQERGSRRQVSLLRPRPA